MSGPFVTISASSTAGRSQKRAQKGTSRLAYLVLVVLEHQDGASGIAIGRHEHEAMAMKDTAREDGRASGGAGEYGRRSRRSYRNASRIVCVPIALQCEKRLHSPCNGPSLSRSRDGPDAPSAFEAEVGSALRPYSRVGTIREPGSDPTAFVLEQEYGARTDQARHRPAGRQGWHAGLPHRSIVVSAVWCGRPAGEKWLCVWCTG